MICHPTARRMMQLRERIWIDRLPSSPARAALGLLAPSPSTEPPRRQAAASTSRHLARDPPCVPCAPVPALESSEAYSPSSPNSVTRLLSTSPPLPFLSAGTLLQDLLVYDPAAMAWTDLSAAASGTPPSAREGHGFTSAGGKLYVHGGFGGSGECQERQRDRERGRMRARERESHGITSAGCELCVHCQCLRCEYPRAEVHSQGRAVPEPNYSRRRSENSKAGASLASDQWRAEERGPRLPLQTWIWIEILHW